MSDFIGVITALVGLATALVTYRVAVRQTVAAAERRGRVVALEDPGVRLEYWNPKRFIWLQGVFGVIYVVILLAIVGWELAALLPAVVGIVMGIGLGRLLRRQPPSRVMKAASVVIADKRSAALRLCMDALAHMGAKIARINEDTGVIQAKMPMTFWSWGNIINITVASKDAGRTEIKVSSDSINPSVQFDFGANGRLVRRIVAGIIGS